MNYAYIGCRTTKERNARGLGIQVYRVDEHSGEWQHIQTVTGLINPSYLEFDRNKQYLYSIHGDFSEISAFKIEPDSGHLTFINQVSTEGLNPVHLAIDKQNKHVIVANLQSGNVTAISRDESNGALQQVVDSFVLPGKVAGQVSHPHQTMLDQNAGYIVVPAQGRLAGVSGITVLKFDAEQDKFEQADFVNTREIAEARHVVFHPNNQYMYLVNEKDNTVCLYYFEAAKGILEARQILPTLPATYTGEGQASGIVISHNGRFLHVSNRKHDSIATYAINQTDGMLSTIEFTATDGKTPRFITIGEHNHVLYVANEDSDTVIRYEVGADGALTRSGEPIITGSPVCIVFKQV